MRAYIIIRVIVSIVTALCLSLYVLICITNGCDNAIAYQADRSRCPQGNLCLQCFEHPDVTYTSAELNATCAMCANGSAPDCGHRLKYKADFEECKKIPFGAKVLELPHLIDWVRYFIFSMVMLNTVRIFFSLAAYRTYAKYFTKYLNILELVVSISVIAMAIDVEQDNKFDLHTPVGACSVLCSWSYLMITIGELPFFGTYIAMFNKVRNFFFFFFPKSRFSSETCLCLFYFYFEAPWCLYYRVFHEYL